MQLGDEQSFRLLIHERNRKFSGGFDEVFRLEGIEGDPHADPGAERERYAECWVRTVRPTAWIGS
jgi:hypothetical protein